MTLRPVDQLQAAEEVDVDAGLTAAVLGLRDAVLAAVAGAPRFELESARIELRFVVTGDAHVRLITGSDRFDEAAHTLALHLTAPST